MTPQVPGFDRRGLKIFLRGTVRHPDRRNEFIAQSEARNPTSVVFSPSAD
jgi:hypothetical protein